MPKFDERDGIAFYLYGADHNPPHVHCFYAEHEVLLVIATGKIYAGMLPKPQLHAARDWLDENRVAVAREWQRLNPGARP